MIFLFFGIIALLVFIYLFVLYQSKHNYPASFKLIVFTTILLLVLSLSIYLYLGTSELSYQKSEQAKNYAKLTDKLSDLAQSINHNPKDVYAWFLLAEGHFKLGNYPKAKKIIEQAYQLDLENGSIDYGEILLVYAQILTSENDYDDKFVFSLLNQANNLLTEKYQSNQFNNQVQKNKIENQLIELRWLLGFKYFQIEQYQNALAIWQSLENFQLSPKQANILKQSIEQITITEQNQFNLTINLNLDDKLLTKINHQAVIFISLKQKGSAMPIAAKQIQNLSFPLSVELNAKDLLNPSTLIDKSQTFYLQGFIANQRTASINSGDLISDIVEINPLDNYSNEIISLEINQIY